MLHGLNLLVDSVGQVLDWNGGEANPGEVRKRSEGEKQRDLVRETSWSCSLSRQRLKETDRMCQPSGLDDISLRSCATGCVQVPVVGSGHEPGGERQGQDGGSRPSLL